MISALNDLVDLVERSTADPVDVVRLAGEHGTTEYHLRRMFSAIAGMPLSEYVRRRRMTLAAAQLVEHDESLLDVAIRFGYGSADAFGRAFRSVHGAAPSEVRSHGGPIRTQTVLRFRLSVEGSTTMHVHIVTRPALVLVGRAARVPLVHHGVNPAIQHHIAAIEPGEHARLKGLNTIDPAGILAVTLQDEPDQPEGSEITYLHGVALEAGDEVPNGLDAIPVAAGSWAVFASSGPFPEALQQLWASTATEWFPSNPWRLRTGPSILRYLELTESFASFELWLPVERA